MDPFIWGFVRGGSATMAIGSPFLVAAFAYYGHVWYAVAMMVGCLAMIALFVVNESRRPW